MGLRIRLVPDKVEEPLFTVTIPATNNNHIAIGVLIFLICWGSYLIYDALRFI